ncbi:MAG: hypothetical protein IJC34_10695, partial [Lentisphaeria bacterium]|nr:hypothetical protein [Lentisphaeria bacterium]
AVFQHCIDQGAFLLQLYLLVLRSRTSNILSFALLFDNSLIQSPDLAFFVNFTIYSCRTVIAKVIPEKQEFLLIISGNSEIQYYTNGFRRLCFILAKANVSYSGVKRNYASAVFALRATPCQV